MTTAVTPPSKLVRNLTRKVGRAICDYGMIEAGDRVMVAVSGGKDSYTLLDLLERLRGRAPVRFEIIACNVDQGFTGFRSDIVEEFLRARDFRYHIEVSEVASTIRKKMEPGTTPCSMCSRLRRGILYRLASELKCNKVALGHHADDVIETLLMLQFFNGQIKTLPPVLAADNGLHTVIRPLIYLWEKEIIEYTKAVGFPVVCCCCPACGDPSSRRQQIKGFLKRLEEAHPGIKTSLLKATSNVQLRFLMDPRYLPPLANEAPRRSLRALAPSLYST